MTTLNNQWFRGITNDKDKKDLFEIVVAASFLRRRLTEILGSWEEAEKAKEISGDYTNPNWPYVAADRNGFLRAVNHMKRLLTLDQGETK